MSGDQQPGTSKIKPGHATRSAGPVLDPDLVYPPYHKFQPVEKLPTNKSVICMVRHFLQCHGGDGKKGGMRGVTEQKAIKEVAKQVIHHQHQWLSPFPNIGGSKPGRFSSTKSRGLGYSFSCTLHPVFLSLKLGDVDAIYILQFINQINIFNIRCGASGMWTQFAAFLNARLKGK